MTPLTFENIAEQIRALFGETFVEVQGYYLDKGTSLFETLATITAEEASRPVSATCASLAAQTAHVRFYLDVLEVGLKGEEIGRNDWGQIWRTVQAVTPDEWEASQARLRASYERILALLNDPTTWRDTEAFVDAIAIVVHTAYHLGEIRQALCTIKGT